MRCQGEDGLGGAGDDWKCGVQKGGEEKRMPSPIQVLSHTVNEKHKKRRL